MRVRTEGSLALHRGHDTYAAVENKYIFAPVLMPLLSWNTILQSHPGKTPADVVAPFPSKQTSKAPHLSAVVPMPSVTASKPRHPTVYTRSHASRRNAFRTHCKPQIASISTATVPHRIPAKNMPSFPKPVYPTLLKFSPDPWQIPTRPPTPAWESRTRPAC